MPILSFQSILKIIQTVLNVLVIAVQAITGMKTDDEDSSSTDN